MEHVNYEERYPIVVTEDSPKYIVDQPSSNKNPSVAVTDSYPEVVSPTNPYLNAVDLAYPHAIPPKEQDYHENVDDVGAGERRFCGMSKRAFLLVLVAVVLIIGAIAGAVGGVKATQEKKAPESILATASLSSTNTVLRTSTATSSTSTTSVSPTSLATTLDTTKSVQSLGISMYLDPDGKVYFHLFHRQGSNIGYRVYASAGNFKAPKSLDFTTAPKDGTPLAAVETSSSAKSYVTLFYLDESNNIVLANYSSTLGNSTLTLTVTVQVVATANVHASSQLAAIDLGDYGYRLYYQAPDGAIQEMIGVDSEWTIGTALSAIAIGGSPLTISSIATPQMNIFYVDATTKTLFNIAYKDGWQTPAGLSPLALEAWDGTSTALAAVAQAHTTPSLLRIYYIGSDQRIYELFDPGAETNWTDVADRAGNWPNADFTAAGGLVGVAWDDEIRVYYASDGGIEQLALSGTSWHVSSY